MRRWPFNREIDTIHANLIGLGIANELKKQQIQLTEEQTKQINS